MGCLVKWGICRNGIVFRNGVSVGAKRLFLLTSEKSEVQMRLKILVAQGLLCSLFRIWQTTAQGIPSSCNLGRSKKYLQALKYWKFFSRDRDLESHKGRDKVTVTRTAVREFAAACSSKWVTMLTSFLQESNQ